MLLLLLLLFICSWRYTMTIEAQQQHETVLCNVVVVVAIHL